MAALFSRMRIDMSNQQGVNSAKPAKPWYSFFTNLFKPTPNNTTINRPKDTPDVNAVFGESGNIRRGPDYASKNPANSAPPAAAPPAPVTQGGRRRNKKSRKAKKTRKIKRSGKSRKNRK
jgi:hypothetical protein